MKPLKISQTNNHLRHLEYLSAHIPESGTARETAFMECDRTLDQLIELGHFVVARTPLKNDYQPHWSIAYSQAELNKFRGDQ